MLWGGLTVVACNVMGPAPGADNDGDASAGSSGIGGASGVSGTGGSGTGGGSGDASAGKGGAAGTEGGSTDTSQWWQYTDPANGCLSEGIPTTADRPPSNLEGASLPPIYLAQTRIRFGTTNDDKALTANPEAWRAIGFDFDKTCTRSRDCLLNDNPSTPVDNFICANTRPGDGNNCRDNEIGKLFKIAESSTNTGRYFGMTEPDWNCELHRGGFSVIFKISNYTGELNDPFVRVDIYNSTGTKNTQLWKCRSSTTGPDITGILNPDWYNQSPWPPGQGQFQIPTRNILPGADVTPGQLPDAAVNDPLAYVKNGHLVARFPQGSEVALLGVRTPVPGFRLILDRGVMAVRLRKLTEDDNTWSMEGTMGGVVNPNIMLNSFEEIGYCRNMCGSFNSVTQYLTGNRDSFGTEEVAPSVACTHLSYATSIRAREATVDLVLDDTLPPYGEPLNPECPNPRHPGAPRANCYCPTGDDPVCPDGGT
ncbi:MAG TPA: hypothetical protein VK524_34920 [Polyangiaceae bacterium]|nr:hypothetical protein [Polyangiaceae bacterium]